MFDGFRKRTKYEIQAKCVYQFKIELILLDKCKLFALL